MKIHRLEVYVIDFNGLGAESVKSALENHQGISVQAEAIDTVDIGDWHGNHPLNQQATNKRRYFNDKLGEIPV